MGGYPPGMSKRDFIRAGIDEPHHHEHEWIPHDHRDELIIEDGAAIFHLRCNYAEGRYGEGWECEETKSYRFEYAVLESPKGTAHALYDITEWESNPEMIREEIIKIEEAWHGGDSDVEIDIDPDPDDGEVSLTLDGYTLVYAPKN